MIEGYITGLFPRNDDLAMTWKRFEWRQIDENTFKDALKRSVKEVVDIQVKEGLTYVHDPQIDWHDIFRPFTDINEIIAGPLTRYFENNTFYRKLIFLDQPKYPKELLKKYIHKDAFQDCYKWIITLPGPYTIYRLSAFSKNIDKIKAVSNVLENAIKELHNYGYSFITLEEPALVYYNANDYNVIDELYNFIKQYSNFIRIHLFYGDVLNKIKELSSLPISGFSIDMQYTDIRKLGCIDKIVILGAIDSQNTLIEDVDKLSDIIINYIKKCDVNKIAITNNVDLDFLPYNVAVKKISILGKLFKKLIKIIE